jgi:hypothetical protein
MTIKGILIMSALITMQKGYFVSDEDSTSRGRT